MKVKSVFFSILESILLRQPAQSSVCDTVDWAEGLETSQSLASTTRSSPYLCMSPWWLSGAKRLFDCTCVLLVLPLLIPVLLVIALAVRLTSHGPALFLQKRVGRCGQTFTILKFRTMIQATDFAHHAVTTSGNQHFTPIGPFLRRWKLDELPQLLNVLVGQMSLVAPPQAAGTCDL